MFKKFMYVVAGLIAIALIVGLFLPRHVLVERSISIAAPPAQVFALCTSFHNFNKWSPWAARDPEAKYEFSGPEQGVGAKMTWTSENPEVGDGSQEIIEVSENEYVKLRLAFGEQTGETFAGYNLVAEGEGTRFTWTLDADMGVSPIGRLFGLMMDRLIGADYETGLAALKKVAEAGEGPAEAETATPDTATPATPATAAPEAAAPQTATPQTATPQTATP